MAGKYPVRADAEQRSALVALSHSRDRGEADRARAILLTLSGWTSGQIAQAFGVREDTVRFWRSAFMTGGLEALKTSVAPGPAPVKAERALAVAEEVLSGPVADRPNWTLPRLADEIETRAGVTVLHGSGSRAHRPLPRPGSGDADGLRASQLQHAVQDLDRHVHLSRPTLIRTRAQPVPDHALEPADGGLGPGARVVARGLLPAHPALLGDEVQVAVPLRRRGLGRGAGHGGRARRNDDVRARVALGHGGVDALLVVRAVRREGGDRVRDLVQQGADLGGIVFVAVGQGGGHDPAGLGVHAEMELPPRPAPLGAVLLHQPLARAVELQPRAVDQQVHGAGIAASAAIGTVAARLRPRHLQRLGPAAQGGVVRHGGVEPEQADDGADQPFGLPVRQPEHGLERQRRQDRQVGILGLPAPARAPPGLPRLVRKPDRQAAAPAQALVVIAPVRDLALLLRDVVASVLVQLEGQGGHPGSDGGLPCYLDRAPGATRGIPATTCPGSDGGPPCYLDRTP